MVAAQLRQMCLDVVAEGAEAGEGRVRTGVHVLASLAGEAHEAGDHVDREHPGDVEHPVEGLPRDRLRDEFVRVAADPLPDPRRPAGGQLVREHGS
ncbi:hypothetical protein ACWDZ4_22640 [Streptomyces sp. NPDC003016]